MTKALLDLRFNSKKIEQFNLQYFVANAMIQITCEL